MQFVVGFVVQCGKVNEFKSGRQEANSIRFSLAGVEESTRIANSTVYRVGPTPSFCILGRYQRRHFTLPAGKWMPGQSFRSCSRPLTRIDLQGWRKCRRVVGNNPCPVGKSGMTEEKARNYESGSTPKSSA
jgi:hypothetical protein